MTSQELSYLVWQGLEIKATYDFYDLDRNLESEARSRWGGGGTVMPRAFLALEGLVRNTHIEPGPALAGKDFDEGVLHLHFLY